MRKALQTGHDAPIELIEFDTEQAFWERFGARLSPMRLDEWPRQKLEKYRDIILVMTELQREKAAAASGGAAATQSPQDTERIFQEMARRNREKKQ